MFWHLVWQGFSISSLGWCVRFWWDYWQLWKPWHLNWKFFNSQSVIELVFHFKNWLVAMSQIKTALGDWKWKTMFKTWLKTFPLYFWETILTYGKQWIALVQMHGWRSWYFVKWYFWCVLSSGRCSGSFLWGNENGGVWQKDSSGLSQQMAVFNGKSKSRNFSNFHAYLIGVQLNLALLWYNFLTTIGLFDIAYYSITIP